MTWSRRRAPKYPAVFTEHEAPSTQALLFESVLRKHSNMVTSKFALALTSNRASGGALASHGSPPSVMMSSE